VNNQACIGLIVFHRLAYRKNSETERRFVRELGLVQRHAF
jgi:hypothetical protein